MADLLKDDFEDSDGVNLVSHTADTPASVWSGFDGDNIEIDTGQYNSGTSSLKVNGSNNYLCYKTWASGQSTGKHTYDFYYRYADQYGTQGEIAFGKGAYSWGDNNWVTLIGHSGGYLRYYTGGGWTNLTTEPLTFGSWDHIEIELDMDANTINIWINNVQVLTNGAFQNSGAGVEPLDTFSVTDNTGAADVWYDDLWVYEGARGSAGGQSPVPIIMQNMNQFNGGMAC